LFWKFFVCILLAQLAATFAIGGAVWLKNRSQQAQQSDIDTSPPAEMAINSASATLEFGGVNALKRMLENMDRRRVYAVDDAGHELLGRIVSNAMLRESRNLLRDEDRRRVVRHVYDPQGNRYLLFLPSSERQRGFEGDRPLLAGLGDAQMAIQGSARMVGERDPRFFNGQPGQQPPPGWPQPGNPPAQSSQPAQAGAATQASMPTPMQPGMQPGGPMGGDMRGPMGPRFQPLTPWVPLMAAVLASLLFSFLLAWYFSRPIRALRQAFDAAAGGDLAPRFVNATGKRGSELNDLGRDFDRMTARLRSLIDGQTRLLHDVSHELRSPLARLQAAIGLAHQQPEKMAASMERVERESVRMDKLVGELLTLARLEAGAIKASQEEISMADLLDQIADDARFEAASQQRSVVQEGEADVVVVGQTDLLGRAIENVVRNAIKHSPENGAVQLQLRTLADKGQLSIRVLDRGPGVAPADLDTIFQPFFRSSNASTEGHGLGLAIAQHVIEAHGGSIKASNRAGGGLCVDIVLPVKSR
jgi:signal transduction histidine kinase